MSDFDAEGTALGLLIQHRKLIELLDGLERELASAEALGEAEPPDLATALVHLDVYLRRFTRELGEHFAAESRTTQHLFPADSPDPRARELRDLDLEHEDLLAAFQGLAAEVAGSSIHPELLPGKRRARLLDHLKEDIARFRQHEAREDELFAQDD